MTVPHPFADDALDGQPTVLLVDDDQVNLLLTGLALRERGFEITEVTGGEEALARMRDWVPDIIVLDAMMPELDGFETCRRLRRMPGFESVPVLMLTGLEDDASITRAYRAGATDFFVKSNQWSLLAGRLHYLLRASRTRIELERNRAKLARAQDLARMGSFDWRRSEGGLGLSPEALRVLGFAPEEQVSLRGFLRMVPEPERRALVAELRNAVRHASPLDKDVPLVLVDGRQRVVHVEAEPEFNEHGHGSGYTGIVQDVTDRRVAEDQIRHLANFDALTGLPNRRQLILRAERALEAARRLQHQCALLLIDLDRFKIINDNLGHSAGDDLLMEVGRRLRACVRHSDQLVDGPADGGSRSHRALEAVGRLGGDEFVALLPEVVGEQDAERVAHRVLEALREPIFVSGQECFVTASVGIALFPRDGTTVVDLLRNADVAMYDAKGQGKNGYTVYAPNLAVRGREKLALDTALHKAIERNELVLHYQPKVDVRIGRMVGVEALMRWKRGDKLVPPGDFIPLAEETGLIVPMSEWALREAAQQVRRWQAEFGFDDSIAVNLPSQLFERTDLVEHIHESVTAAGVNHRVIELEITENSLMKDLDRVKPSLHRLNAIGVDIAIDDFGTGYSSLAYLTTLPIGELKIDRGFVRDLGTTLQSRAVVTTIIALAKSLNMRVVAEGVETLAQLNLLRELDCHIMQGFLFSKAIPGEEMKAWLERTVLPGQEPWGGRAVGSELAATNVHLIAGGRSQR